MMGPPIAPPNWLRFSVSCVGAKKFLALKSPLRTNSNTSPWMSFVPDFVIDVHHGPSANAILGREIVGFDIELLHGVGIRERQIRVEICIVVAAAVHLVIHTARSGSVDIGVLLSGIHAALAVHQAVVARFIHRPGGQKEQ